MSSLAISDRLRLFTRWESPGVQTSRDDVCVRDVHESNYARGRDRRSLALPRMGRHGRPWCALRSPGGPARLTERPIHETRFFGGNSAAFLYAKQHVCSYMTRLTMINELRTRN